MSGQESQRYEPYRHLPDDVLAAKKRSWDEWLQDSLDNDDSGETVNTANVQEWAQQRESERSQNGDGGG